MQPETRFKLKVQQDLKSLVNIWFFKSQEVTVRGIPDILACINGCFVAIELKVKDSRGDDLQEYVLNKIKSKGQGIGYVATPANWPKVLTELKKLDKS